MTLTWRSILWEVTITSKSLKSTNSLVSSTTTPPLTNTGLLSMIHKQTLITLFSIRISLQYPNNKYFSSNLIFSSIIMLLIKSYKVRRVICFLKLSYSIHSSWIFKMVIMFLINGLKGFFLLKIMAFLLIIIKFVSIISWNLFLKTISFIKKMNKVRRIMHLFSCN